MTSPNELSVSQALAQMKSGRLSCGELVEACLARVAAREASVGAWTFLEPDSLRKEALEKDRVPAAIRPPLHGLPIGIKDIIDTAGMPTCRGSRIYAERVPSSDASCVAFMKRAGALVMGKTVTTEFAYFSPGKTRNPHDVERTPGGSSSGSAAAVADFMVPAAFGTQTAGSIIRPASYCGVVGYKPSTGAFSLVGVKALAESLDTLGLLTRHVADVVLLRAALAGCDPEAATIVAQPPRIGLCRTPWWSEADADSRNAVELAASMFARAGAEVDEFMLPAEFERLAADQKEIMAFESARALAYERDAFREQLSPELTELIEAGEALSWSDYAAAKTRARRARIEFASMIQDGRILLSPSAKGSAPLGLRATGDPLFSRMWTLLEVPTISLPGLKCANGLPIGVQLAGGFGEDDRLLANARWCEEALA
ncbi:MAG TPA: amidase [Ramlibacter sp.]|uniref:amidase n=1 Tax=Ramlibacter sp. TaxID=1917967 RepID=UPI002BFBE670|nr:amidase [Ramlibacter sp.]HVZ45427.1 amidase [Ramlibacter sp.]